MFSGSDRLVKYFEVPEEMQGKRLFISFQGAESGIALWLNGHFVGYSEDSFTPSEFELPSMYKKVKTNLQHRYSNGQQAAGAKIRTSSVSPESTEMFIFIQYRKFMFMTFRSVQFRMKL